MKFDCTLKKVKFSIFESTDSNLSLFLSKIVIVYIYMDKRTIYMKLSYYIKISE